MREVLEARLEQWGFPVRTAASARAARDLVVSFDPHVVISDLVLPDATGLALLTALRGENERRTVLLITAYGTIDTAVQAIKAGAADFLTKPLDYVALRKQLESLEERLERESAELGGAGDRGVGPRGAEPAVPESSVASGSAGADSPVSGGLGRSAAWRELQARIEVAAASSAPVLIVGESGSGKEVVARSIHERSERRERPFVAVNAAAVPESLVEGEFFGYERGAFTGANQARAGLFEDAHRGTLFLDEVTEMPLSLQPKFLRVLEDGHVRRLGGRAEMSCDVRLVAATNRDPLGAVAEGRLRQDLFYRLDVLRVEVPPLRARKEDVPLLATHFLEECQRRYGQPAPRIAEDAMQRLVEHSWPGNVRELRNVMERVFVAVRAETLTAEELQKQWLGLTGAEPTAEAVPVGIVIPHGLTAAEAERILILETLKATGNNKAEAARRLGLDVKTIRNKLKAFEPEEPAE